MKILFAADHAGFSLKKDLLVFIRDLGYEAEDLGALEYDEDDDYPDLIAPLARAVTQDPDNLKGIIIGASGQGEAIVANRFRNVRAVVFNGQYQPADGRYTPNEIVLSRQHNNSNVLSLGARFLNNEEAKQAVKLWLEIEFNEEDRHLRRLNKIDQINLS